MQQLPAVTSVLAVEVCTNGVGQCTCSMSPCHLGLRRSSACRDSVSFSFCRFPSPPTPPPPPPPSSSSHHAAASYWVNKLVHQSLRHVGLADDALLVVLTYGAAQLVIVHSRSILSESPQSRNVCRVFDFKNTWWESQEI